MKFQIVFRPVENYGIGFECGYRPGKSFDLRVLLWNRLLIVGWAVD